MSFDKALLIIEANLEEADFCGPIDTLCVEKAEKMLGVSFPDSYKRFLETQGAGDIFGKEIYGILHDPETDYEGVPNGIWMTLDLRKTAGMDHQFVMFAETGYGPYYVIDTSSVKLDGSGPVLLWSVDGQREKVADNFGEFLYDWLQEDI